MGELGPTDLRLMQGLAQQVTRNLYYGVGFREFTRDLPQIKHRIGSSSSSEPTDLTDSGPGSPDAPAGPSTPYPGVVTS